MKTILKIILITVACSLLTVSCTLIDLEDMPDPQPTKGKVTLVTDWSNRSEGIDIPATYTAIFNGEKSTFDKNTNDLPEMEAGIYPLLMYNTADKITPNGSTAVSVATENSIVDPKPGWLFTYAGDISYEADKEKTMTAAMVQQVRQLTIELTIKDGDPAHIESTAATLSGVANSMDFKTNTYTGANLSVIPVFSRNGDKLTATIRLLGLSNQTQKLTLTLIFADGKEQTIENELSGKLSAFNTDKYKPIKLEADLNTPVEAGFEATITGWKVVEGSSGIAW